MKVLALAPFPPDLAPAQRYRIEQWMPHLHRRGIEVTLEPFLDEVGAKGLYENGGLVSKGAAILRGVLRRVSAAPYLARYDVIFVAREAALVGGPWIERLAARSRPVVYDFDDAIWLPQVGSANRRWQWLRAPRKTIRICEMASAVTVGNSVLAEFAGKYANHVTIIPSTIDLENYGPAKRHAETTCPTIGWMGSHSTVRYLEALLPTLQEIAGRRRFRLLVVGARLSDTRGLNVEHREWSSEREAQDLREFDLGVMPLPNDEWTRGKCAMKAIQYLAVGIPAVASPVGMTSEVVRDGETGFLASGSPEWANAIEKLMDSVQLRARLGDSGRKLVTQKYSAEAQIGSVEDVLRTAARAA